MSNEALVGLLVVLVITACLAGGIFLVNWWMARSHHQKHGHA